jgi:hypothetical protein
MFPFLFLHRFARLGLIALPVCMIVGCSTPAQPQAANRAQTAQCSVPGHFCQTFFGP